MGSTTYKEFKQHFEKDRALARRFQKIDVVEPSKDDTIQILAGLKSYFEEHHKITYTDEAIEAAAELSAKYMTDRKLPDKAIDVIDEAGARQMLFPENERAKVIGVAEIEEVVAKMARIPPKSVSKSDTERLQKLPEELRRVVYGQGEAIDQLGGGDQTFSRWFARTGQANWLIPLCRTDRGRQNGSRQTACAGDGR